MYFRMTLRTNVVLNALGLPDELDSIPLSVCFALSCSFLLIQIIRHRSNEFKLANRSPGWSFVNHMTGSSADRCPTGSFETLSIGFDALALPK